VYNRSRETETFINGRKYKGKRNYHYHFIRENIIFADIDTVNMAELKEKTGNPEREIAERRDLPAIGITVGDTNGIGPEIIIQLLADTRILSFCRVVVYGNLNFFNKIKKALKLEDISFQVVDDNLQLNLRKPNLYNAWSEEIAWEPGIPTEVSGNSAAQSLECAVLHLKEGKIAAVVTAPINKANMDAGRFPYPGHTEFFAHHFEAKPVMLLTGELLKVALVTAHVPLKNVAGLITGDAIKETIKTLTASLQKDFAIARPRIAVLGLNPHAGDHGKIGDEDLNIIQPTIKELLEKGQFIYGPFSADGFFASGAYKKYDAVVAMYHDQGLIPFKMLAFEDGVNFTAGLSVVRTSPDHGTAYDIAGKGLASESSLRAAVFSAIEILKNRKEVGKGK